MKNFDYSENGLYFLTICVKNRKKLLCNIVGRVEDAAPYKSNHSTYDFYI